MSKPSLIILAAGMGSRYGGLKQLDSVGPSGETIMDYSIYDAIEAGFGKVIFVIRKDFAEDFKAAVGNKYADKIDVRYVFQELDALPYGFNKPEERVKPWGTGHAVLCAKDAIEENFAVINADDFYGRNAFELLAGELNKEAPSITAVAFILKNTLSDNGTVSRGYCKIDESGSLVSINECHDIGMKDDGEIHYTCEGQEGSFTGDEPVSMNCWGFPQSFCEYLEPMFCDFLRAKGEESKSEFYLPFAVDELITSGREKVQLLTSADKWYGVTYTEDKPEVMSGIKALVDKGIYPASL